MKFWNSRSVLVNQKNALIQGSLYQNRLGSAVLWGRRSGSAFHCLLEGKEYCLIFIGVLWLTHSWKADLECLSLVICCTLKRTLSQLLDPNMDRQFVSTGTSVLCSYVTALSSLRSASRMGLVGLSICVRLSRKSHALLCRLFSIIC